MTDKILVLGATGNVGKPLVSTLLARGEKVKAASRSGHAVEGAEGVAFDFFNPESYGPAFENVDRVFVLLPTGSMQPREMITPLIDCAKARNIKVVFQSVLGADADDAIPYRQIEIALENSGLPYVILRPNWFSNNFHTFWKAGIDQGQIALPAGEGKTSFIDARDIAECAASALTRDEFNGKAYDLTGPQALSYTEAAVVLSQALGKPITYTPVSDEAFIAMLTGAGVPEDYAGFLASIFYPVREGWTSAVTGAVEELTGNLPWSLSSYAKDHLAELGA